MAFTLHEAIARDSLLVSREANIQIRLQNHAAVPWLVLVPEHTGAVELIDLPDTERAQLHLLQDRVSRILLNAARAHKLNVAAIGNIVPQLHIHCIGRFTDDPHWPGPVWGHPLQPYPDPELAVNAWRAHLAEAP